jgi:hypothetical protein
MDRMTDNRCGFIKSEISIGCCLLSLFIQI